VRRNGIAIRVLAKPPDELHGVIQPRQANSDVERTAANVRLDSAGALHDVNQGLANHSQHGTTLPEEGLALPVI
jgi:hypothetical protein